MKKVRENNDKDEEIKLLKEQMQLVKSMKSKNEENLQTVEEALCAQCKRSMEESKNNNINVLQNLKVRDDRTDQFMSRNQI